MKLNHQNANGVPAWIILRDMSSVKHLWSLEFVIRMGTLKDTDRLPADAKRKQVVTTVVAVPKSYTEDDYSF